MLSADNQAMHNAIFGRRAVMVSLADVPPAQVLSVEDGDKSVGNLAELCEVLGSNQHGFETTNLS